MYIIKEIIVDVESNELKGVFYLTKGGFVKQTNRPLFPHDCYKRKWIADKVVDNYKKDDKYYQTDNYTRIYYVQKID